ncbi:MAG: MFS transporter, partial [Bacteroidetes bacterium]|nr:MFS transporter [Bacteroidota bacterium]
TLKFESNQLILIILIIQLVASLGAYVFSKASQKVGNIKALLIQLFVWILVCFLAFMVTPSNKWLFYVVAVLLGMVLGGIQSLSRSTYSKMLPNTGDNASFFSFYELTEKLGIVIGLASYGLVSQIIDQRTAILALALFFVISVVFIVPLLRKNKQFKTP